MCTTAEKNLIHNVNRVLVCALSVAAMTMDGLQVSDAPLIASLIMWLSLAECDALEGQLLDWLQSRKKV